MKNIGIFANDLPETKQVAEKLRCKLLNKGFIINNKNPEVVISVGGDGTLLSAFHHYEKIIDKVYFTAINTGHLGFYTDWSVNEMDELVESLCANNVSLNDHFLLEIGIHKNNENDECYLALNEATLQRVRSTMISDVYINKKLFEHFRGEGLCISTPTGSTAYNKSLGGGVVGSNLKVMQLTEIASINNLVYKTLNSSMIISSEDQLIVVPDSESKFIITVDNLDLSANDIAYIKFSLSKKVIHFLKYKDIDFWSKVHNSFI